MKAELRILATGILNVKTAKNTEPQSLQPQGKIRKLETQKSGITKSEALDRYGNN